MAFGLFPAALRVYFVVFNTSQFFYTFEIQFVNQNNTSWVSSMTYTCISTQWQFGESLLLFIIFALFFCVILALFLRYSCNILVHICIISELFLRYLCVIFALFLDRTNQTNLNHSISNPICRAGRSFLTKSNRKLTRTGRFTLYWRQRGTVVAKVSSWWKLYADIFSLNSCVALNKSSCLWFLWIIQGKERQFVLVQDTDYIVQKTY